MNKIKRRVTIVIASVAVTLTLLSSFVNTNTVQADNNPAAWILCRFEDGKTVYNATVTDLLPYMFRSKSAIADTENVERSMLNALLGIAGFDFIANNEAILGRPLNIIDVPELSPSEANAAATQVSAFERFGMSGLKWTSYIGEWKYYQIDACSSAESVSKTNFGRFYENRKEPLSSYNEVSGSTDPRSIQFNRGFFAAWGSTISNMIANGLFAITKAIVTLAILFVGLAFSDVSSLIGLTESGNATSSSIGIFQSLFTGIFTPLVTLAFVFTGLHMLYHGVIKRQFRQSLNSLAKTVLCFLVAIIISTNPGFWIGVPSRVATYGQALVFNAMTGGYNTENNALCATNSTGDVTEGFGGDLSEDEFDAVSNNMQSALACTMWEVLLFRPWVQGQFGTTYENLNADTLGNINSSWVGTGAVPVGGGQYIENWALFQLSTQTNVHAQIGDDHNVPTYVSGVSADWWRVVDALSNYEEETVTTTPAGAAAEVSMIKQVDNDPIEYWVSWSGNNSAERIGTAFISIIFGILGSFLPLVFGLLSALYGLGLIFLMMVSPVFLLFGTQAGRGQQIFLGWLSLLVNTIIKKIGTGILVLLSFSISMTAMNLVYTIGWFQALIPLILITIILFKNKEQILNSIATIDFGGAFDPSRGLKQITHKYQARAKRAGNVAMGALGGGMAAKATGQDFMTGVKEGGFHQVQTNWYQTQLGRKIAVSFESAVKSRYSKANYSCVVCGGSLQPGQIIFSDDYGNNYCQFCGNESADPDLMMSILDNHNPEEPGVRDTNVTGNKSWLSYSKAAEIMNLNYYEDTDELTWSNFAVEDMIKKNIEALNVELIIFKYKREKLGKQSRPPTIPEPLQEYLDLALINEAWTTERYEYIEKMYREGWKIWYEENAENITGVSQEEINEFLEIIDNHDPEVYTKDIHQLISDYASDVVEHDGSEDDLYEYIEGELQVARNKTRK